VIYVLAYPVFEPNSAERIDAFRAKHEPEWAKLVPPHITLVFGVAERHLQAVSGLIDMVSSQTKAFPVVFASSVVEFDPFEKKHKLYLLCGDGGEHLTILHERLYQGEHRLELSSEHPFQPHLTIASYDKRADVEQIDVSVIGDLPIRTNLSALELVRLDSGQLTTLRTVPFTM